MIPRTINIEELRTALLEACLNETVLELRFGPGTEECCRARILVTFVRRVIVERPMGSDLSAWSPGTPAELRLPIRNLGLVAIGGAVCGTWPPGAKPAEAEGLVFEVAQLCDIIQRRQGFRVVPSSPCHALVHRRADDPALCAAVGDLSVSGALLVLSGFVDPGLTEGASISVDLVLPGMSPCLGLGARVVRCECTGVAERRLAVTWIWEVPGRAAVQAKLFRFITQEQLAQRRALAK